MMFGDCISKITIQENTQITREVDRIIMALLGHEEDDETW